MTEQEAKDALFKLHFEYITKPPKERLKVYDEYIAQRRLIQKELSRVKMEKLENIPKTK